MFNNGAVVSPHSYQFELGRLGVNLLVKNTHKLCKVVRQVQSVGVCLTAKHLISGKGYKHNVTYYLQGKEIKHIYRQNVASST